MTAKLRALIPLFLATAVALAGLLWLGVWQLQRLAWKEALIAEMEGRVGAPPAPLPPPADWATLRADDYEYRNVRVTGTFDLAHQALVFRAIEKPRGRWGGPGYLVMTPLRLPTGEAVMVNRGFVPEARRSAASTGPAGLVEIKGLMRASEGRTWFTPTDDPASGVWFTRDVERMAAALAPGPHAPFFIDAEASGGPDALPEGGETVLSFPNNHLSYALTWFGMALALLGVSGAYAVSQLRENS